MSDRGVQQVVVVTSPKAGSGAHRDQLPVLAQMLRQTGLRVKQTASIDEMKQSVADFSPNPSGPYRSVVVAAGGDGTLSLVAENVDADVPIVPMPLGTENLLATYFGFRPTAKCIFDAIGDGHSHRVDAGCANGKLFLVMASCGFDAEVVRGVHLKRRGHINRLSYAGPIWRAIRRYQFPRINVTTQWKTSTPQETSTPQNSRDSQLRENGSADQVADQAFADQLPTDEAFGWAMVFNLPCYGGALMIEPDAIGTDGELDLIAFRKRSIASGLRYFGGVITGGHTRFTDVVRRRVQTIELDSDQPVPFQLDGDYAGRLPLKIETLPRRLHLLLPAISVPTIHH